MNYMRRLPAYLMLAVLFCFFSTVANAGEIQLLGIKLGSSGMTILKKYGNPTQIRVGGAAAPTNNQGMGPGGAPGRGGPMGGLGMPGGMRGPGMMPGMMPGMRGPGMGGPGMRGPGMGGPGMGGPDAGGAGRPGPDRGDNRLQESPISRVLTALVHLVSATSSTAMVQGTSAQPFSVAQSFPGGMPFPGGMGPGGMGPGGMGPGGMGPGGMRGPGMFPGGVVPGGGPGGMPATIPANQMPGGGASVVYVYNFSDNRTAEFNLNSDGIVMQIAIYGAEWKGQKTTRGVRLGSTYKDVLKKCGYPENHIQNGVQLVLPYAKRDRVVFTLAGKVVVGITIALQ